MAPQFPARATPRARLDGSLVGFEVILRSGGRVEPK